MTIINTSASLDFHFDLPFSYQVQKGEDCFKVILTGSVKNLIQVDNFILYGIYWKKCMKEQWNEVEMNYFLVWYSTKQFLVVIQHKAILHLEQMHIVSAFFLFWVQSLHVTRFVVHCGQWSIPSKRVSSTGCTARLPTGKVPGICSGVDGRESLCWGKKIHWIRQDYFEVIFVFCFQIPEKIFFSQ